jgi:hypothetical protein
MSGKTVLEMPPDVLFDSVSQEIVLPPSAALGYDNSNDSLRFHGNRKLAIQGTRSVLVVNVAASNAKTSFSEAALSDSVFGTFGDPVNLRSQYAACSHGKLVINPATSRNGRSANIRNGVVTIPVSTSTSQGDVAMRNAVTEQLNYQFSVSSPNQLATHVMYCLPSGTMTGVAYAFIDSWLSVYSNDWCTYVTTQMHELGHNCKFEATNTVRYSFGDGFDGLTISIFYFLA